MKYVLLLLLLSSLLFSEELEKPEEDSEDVSGLVQVKDTSGLSDAAVRKKAEAKDSENSKKVSLEKIYEVANPDGTVDVKKLQALWEDQSPTPKKYDWVQTKSGEWFKGDIKAMFNEELDFDSDEIGLYSFDFDDVKQIKSFHTVSVNIDGVASFTGIIRMKDDTITIIQGDKEFTFPVEQIISFAYKGESTLDYWSGKGSLNLDQQKGNTDQKDYTANFKLQRRTATTRLALKYTGNVSYVNHEETKNNHRINAIFDVFISKQLFYTPIYAEYYKNSYQNIASQFTASIGIGYKFIDTKDIDWEISTGPGVIRTKYDTIYQGESSDTVTSAALQTRTNLEVEITDDLTFLWDHQFAITDKNSGYYKHHMTTTLEVDITDAFSLDFSYVWDHLSRPERDSTGETPYKDDYRTLMGFGIDF